MSTPDLSVDAVDKRFADHVAVDRLSFAGARISIRATENSAEVDGLPPDIELVLAPVSEHFRETR